MLCMPSRGSFSSQTLILQVPGTETILPLSRYNAEMSKKPPTVVSNSGVCKQKRRLRANLMWSQHASQDAARSSKGFDALLKKIKGFSNRGSSSAVSGRAVCLTLHANATRLMKSFKASIYDESTAAIVFSEGHRNDSEVPVAGNVEANPSLDPRGPLAPSPDPVGRKALSASEARSFFLYLLVNSETPLRNTSSELWLLFPGLWTLHLS